MKNYTIIISCFLAAFLLSACQENGDDTRLQPGAEFIFYPTIQEMVMQTKAANNNFFEEGDEVEIIINQTSGSGVTTGPVTFIYQYGSDGVFRGNPDGYHFPADDSYITDLEIVWPTQAWKEQNTNHILTDQRELGNYRKSDWLNAASSIEGLMPAEAPVPVEFAHQHSVLEFQLVGQTINDLDIRSLVIELNAGGEETAYWAYCGNANGRAELMLEAGTAIVVDTDNYLFGRAEIADKNNNLVSCNIIMPRTNILLKSGYKYLITLSSSGYDINGILTLGGWYSASSDSGIGIPLTPPTQDQHGNYLIHTPAELISLSYLIRHYTDNTTVQWHQQTYILVDNLVFTESDIEHWVSIPRQDFTGRFLLNENVVETISYVINGVVSALNLFE